MDEIKILSKLKTSLTQILPLSRSSRLVRSFRCKVHFSFIAYLACSRSHYASFRSTEIFPLAANPEANLVECTCHLTSNFLNGSRPRNSWRQLDVGILSSPSYRDNNFSKMVSGITLELIRGIYVLEGDDHRSLFAFVDDSLIRRGTFDEIMASDRL